MSDKVLTLPNVLSVVRLLGVPFFFWLILIEQDVLALVVLVVSGFTDYLDGKLARVLNQITRLGQRLDPIADRLYLLALIVALAIREIIPWWLVIALAVREFLILAMAPSVKRNGLPVPPVTFAGKAATFCMIYAFPLVLLGQQPGTIGAIAEPVGWAFVWWGFGLHWFAGALYGIQVRTMVRGAKAARA